MNELELQLLDWIQSHMSNPLCDGFFSTVTHLADGGLIWIALTIVFLVFPKTRKYGVVMAISIALEVLCVNVLVKPLAARTRPYEIKQGIELLIQKPVDYSFPSGHAGVSFAAVSALFFSKHKAWIPTFVLAFVIAFSRLYLYVHYPTDVLFGAAFGVIAGWVGAKVVNRKERQKHENN